MNAGKKFENTFKSSVPDYCVYWRLRDSPQSFNQTSALRFSWKNPCDCFIFDSKKGFFYALELKTTKGNSFSFEDINIKEKQPSRMIHKHQIIALRDYGEYDRVFSGFIFNFRNEKENTQTTYFQDIDDFITMTNEVNKKSFNKKDLLKYNPIEIAGTKKRVNYKWDIDKFLKNMGAKGEI